MKRSSEIVWNLFALPIAFNHTVFLHILSKDVNKMKVNDNLFQIFFEHLNENVKKILQLICPLKCSFVTIRKYYLRNFKGQNNNDFVRYTK